MRHIAIILIFGAVLQGCSENRSKVVYARPEHKVQTEKLAPAPRVITQKTTPVAQAMKNDKVTSVQAAPSVPAKKKALRAMTFNESQFSDDASDYPSSIEAKKLETEKYNE